MTETKYNEMFAKFQKGQITEAAWYAFCMEVLTTNPTWLGVIGRLRWT
jgi:hypothetical protein